jgi:hypothetical protein
MYPIPLRFMRDDQKFAKYQWVNVEIQRNPSDPRPESYRINLSSFSAGEKIPPEAGWSRRSKYVLQPNNLVQSVEDIQLQQASSNRSLGIMKPRSVDGVRRERVTPKEKQEFEAKWNLVTRQEEFPYFDDSGEPVAPLRAPDFRLLFAAMILVALSHTTSEFSTGRSTRSTRTRGATMTVTQWARSEKSKIFFLIS